MPDDDHAAVDAQILAALERAGEHEWNALWDAVDALRQETTFATWVGGEAIRTDIVDGEARPVHQVPYPVYTESVERLREAVGRLGLFVPFDWMNWDGLRGYRDDPRTLATAPVGDAVRLITAIQRSERFGDGNIEGALEAGILQAAVERLRRWHAIERPTQDE